MCELSSLSPVGEVPYQGDGMSSEAVPRSMGLIFALCLPRAVPAPVINNRSRSAAVVGTGTRHMRFLSTLFPFRVSDLNGSVRTYSVSSNAFF